MAFRHLLFLCTYDLQAAPLPSRQRPPPPSSPLSAHPPPIDRDAGGILTCKRPAARLFRPRRRDRCPLRGLWQKKCPAADTMIGVSRRERATKEVRRACAPFGVSRCRRLSGYAWMDTWATKKGLDRFVEPLKDLVGMRGFEPPTTCTPCRYASQAALHPESKSHCTVLSSEGQGFCAGKRRSVLTRGSQRGANPMLSIPDGVFFSREANECVFETIGKASVFHSDQWSLL